MTPPMTPPETQGFDRDALVGELRAVWRSLAEACDGIAEADWDIATRCPGWTVRDQLSHVLGTELMLAGAPAPGVDDVGEHVRNDIGRVNEAWIAQRRTLPGPDVLAEFREITSGRLDVLAAMTQANFDADSWTPAGPATFGRFMQIRVFDSWMHDLDVRAALGRPALRSGPVVERALAEIALALGFVVGRKAGAPQGASVAVIVTGDSPHRFDVIVDGRASLSPVPIDAPTASLTLDLELFAAAVGGRVDPSAGPLAAAVGLEGDQELARRVLAELAFVI